MEAEERRAGITQSLQNAIEQSGFDTVGGFSAAALNPRQEVRDMCAADKCQAYDKKWSCPPACGSLQEFAQKFAAYQDAFVFQTIAQMEDSMDWEAIEEASELHRQRAKTLINQVVELFGDESQVMFMGAGTGCDKCSECTYPDAPCRFPDSVHPSMEAGGLLVSEVCETANIPYYHGTNTVAFCSCLLY